MKNIVIYEVGDIVRIKDPYTSNQLGGTVQIKGTARAEITDAWYDDEIGYRYKGLLLDEAAIELSKEAGKITFDPEIYRQYGEQIYQEALNIMKEYEPRRVYFGNCDIV